jgi:hypothetical protein
MKALDQNLQYQPKHNETPQSDDSEIAIFWVISTALVLQGKLPLRRGDQQKIRYHLPTSAPVLPVETMLYTPIELVLLELAIVCKILEGFG